MKWSFSHRASFRRCQRQWYYRHVLANARAKDPLRQEAYRLSKLVTVYSWRGKLVDNVISHVVVPALNQGHRVGLDEALRAALIEFEAGMAASAPRHRSGADRQASDGSSPAFFEIEYGSTLTDQVLQQARSDVEQSLSNFFANSCLWNLLQGANRLIAQRSLSFTHDDTAVSAVPDLIVFYPSANPLIVDWKVHRNPVPDSWLQLATYAVALARCKPHRDWPVASTTDDPSRIRLVELQLLNSETREHAVTPEDVEDLQNLISDSATEMLLSLGTRRARALDPQDFPVAGRPTTCQVCNFRKLCWEGEP